MQTPFLSSLNVWYSGCTEGMNKYAAQQPPEKPRPPNPHPELGHTMALPNIIHSAICPLAQTRFLLGAVTELGIIQSPVLGCSCQGGHMALVRWISSMRNSRFQAR